MPVAVKRKNPVYSASTSAQVPEVQGPTLSIPSQKRGAFSRLGGNKLGPPEQFRGTVPSLWQFWKHGVTSSFIDKYYNDQEQARLEYVEGWSTRDENEGRAFGSCIHWILQQAYETRKDFLKNAPGKADVTAWVEGYHRHWHSTHPGPTQSQTELLDKICGIAEATLPCYFTRWAGDFHGRYNYGYGQGASKPVEWLSLEEIFCVNYTYPDGKTVPVRGRRDAIIRDEHKRIVVFDTKIKSRIDEKRIAKMLGNDFQAMLYTWAGYQQHKAGLLLERPSGAVINVYKKPAQYQGKKETLVDFHARLGEIYSKPEDFDENYFRVQVRVSSGEMESWVETRLDPVMDEIRGWWEGRYPHKIADNHVELKYGAVDMFEPITMGNFVNCFKRAEVFPELPEIAA